MERRFRVRLDELLDDAEVPLGLLRGVLPRLQDFLQPFVQALHTPEQQTNAHHYVHGLLSDLDSKDVESIAYLHDRERQGLQNFIGQSAWHNPPLLDELALARLGGRGPCLRCAGVSGGAETAGWAWFRAHVGSRGERQWRGGRTNPGVRGVGAPEPPYRGHGRRPQVPFTRVDRWCSALPARAWETVEVRDGEKGPLVVQVTRTLVQARTEGRPSDGAELLVVFRERPGDGPWQDDYLLADA